jgi:hypothetical protein
MIARGLQYPTVGKHLPTDAADWNIGFVQLLIDSKCKTFFGKSKTSIVSEWYQEDYFSLTKQASDHPVSDFPLVDKITDDRQEQKQTVDKSDPAYSKDATSPALLQDVFKHRKVCVQLAMQDRPEENGLDLEISFQKPHEPPKLYLNRVEKRCIFRTMLAVYKPGFCSKEFSPIAAVDWQYNVAATRDLNPKAKKPFKLTPMKSLDPDFKSDFINYSAGSVPAFDFSSLTKTQTVCEKTGEMIFETPNNVQKWLGLTQVHPQSS